MSKANRMKLLCGIVLTAVAMWAAPTHAQDPDSAPNAFRPGDAWAKQPMGRGFGMTIGLNVDRDGKGLVLALLGAAPKLAPA